MLKLNLCLLPTEETRELVRFVSARLEARGIPTFVKQGFVPHCTLFMTDYADQDERKVEEYSRRVSLPGCPVACPIVPRLRITSSGWVFIDLEKPEWLTALAASAVECLSSIRAKDVRRPKWLRDHPEKEQLFELFGSPSVGVEFEPHFTLTKIRDNQPAFAGESIDLLAGKHASFGQLALGTANDDGQFSDYIVVHDRLDP